MWQYRPGRILQPRQVMMSSTAEYPVLDSASSGPISMHQFPLDSPTNSCHMAYFGHAQRAAHAMDAVATKKATRFQLMGEILCQGE
jgi:hypothetical protein